VKTKNIWEKEEKYKIFWGSIETQAPEE